MNRPPFMVRLAIAGRTAMLAAAVVGAACNATPGSLAPTTTASLAGTATPVASPVSSSAAPLESLLAQPPDAFVAVEPMPRVKGALGTYSWLATGSDAPWLPGTPVALPAGRVARITVDPGGRLLGWRLRTGAADGSGTNLLGSGTAEPIEFTVPRAPTTVQLELDYGTTGTAAWYWAVRPAP
jgi:hypothetical protein